MYAMLCIVQAQRQVEALRAKRRAESSAQEAQKVAKELQKLADQVKLDARTSKTQSQDFKQWAKEGAPQPSRRREWHSGSASISSLLLKRSVMLHVRDLSTSECAKFLLDQMQRELRR